MANESVRFGTVSGGFDQCHLSWSIKTLRPFVFVLFTPQLLDFAVWNMSSIYLHPNAPLQPGNQRYRALQYAVQTSPSRADHVQRALVPVIQAQSNPYLSPEYYDAQTAHMLPMEHDPHEQGEYSQPPLS